MKPMIGGEYTTPKYGLFLGGCAWGCAYYIGVVRAAREKWVSGINRVQTHIPVGGSSAGALMALGVALDKTDAEMFQMYYDFGNTSSKTRCIGQHVQIPPSCVRQMDTAGRVRMERVDADSPTTHWAHALSSYTGACGILVVK